ncbi:hypothetical protein GGI43DRAFT_383518 [Trichoderma evansii]
MPPKTSNASKTSKAPHNFEPILRQENIAAWRLKPQATDYSVRDAATSISDNDAVSIEQNAAIWHTLEHVPGIQVLHTWETDPKSISQLAGYNGMPECALANFTDTVVCDIIPEGLLLVSKKFGLNAKALLPADFANIICELPEDMATLYTKLRANITSISTATAQTLIKPAELVNQYTSDNQLKNLVDTIASSLPRPMYLPITRKTVTQSDKENDTIDVAATILAHSIQILLFAPTRWSKDIIYKRDTNEYTHRYPTAAGHGGNCRTVAQLFSLEDLHRSILLIYLTVYRRSSGDINSTRAPWSSKKFLGYFDVKTQRRALDGQSKYMTQIVNRIKPLYDILKPMTKEDHATPFKSIIEERKLLDFSKHGVESSAIQEFVASHPDEEQGLIETMHRSYALEMIFKGHPPPEDTNLIQVCDRFGIQWPKMQLYPNSQVEPLKPHQIADLGVIFEKLDTLGHVLFCNEMGLGKTKVFAAMVECATRDIEAKVRASADDPGEVFYPTLVVSSPSTIHQTHAEFKRNFPGLNVLLYYWWNGGIRIFGRGAQIIEKKEFLQKLRTLKPTDPESGRTVILTSYQTLHRRVISKSERKFVFIKRPQGGPAPKRPRNGTLSLYPSTFEADEAVAEADVEMVDESQALKKRVREYSPGDPELKSNQIRFLDKDETTKPDGNLVELKLSNPELSKFRWRFLIVDDAHNARKATNAYHKMFQLLEWRSLKPEYDPSNDNVWGDGTATKGIFTPEFKEQNPSEGWDQMQSFYRQTGVKIWQLCPPIVEEAGQRASWSSSFGQKVVSVILRILSLCRSLHSRLLLPDGTVSYPDADLLPMTIATEELNYDKKNQNRIKEHGRESARKSFATVRSGDFILSQKTLTRARKSGVIAFSPYREGVLVAHDWRNNEIINSDMGDVKKISKRDKVPILGVKHIEGLLLSRNDGLGYFFNKTRLDLDANYHSDRSGWLHWLCATSPILSRSLELAHRYIHEQKERLIIYVDTPWIQQMMYVAMKMAGFNTSTARSLDKPNSRIKAVQLFSDPTSKAEVFVANIAIMSAGLNLHTACSKGLLINMPFSANTILQIHGRLNRLGQTKAVKWHNLKVKNSFHDHQERVLLTKWSHQLSAEANLPSWITGTLKEVVLFELMKAYFNHPFNRYAWVVVYDRDGVKMDYYTEGIIKLGHACSAIAKLVIASKKSQYWTDNDEYLMVALTKLVTTMTLDGLEDWLTFDEATLRSQMEAELEGVVAIVKTDETAVKEAKLLKQKVDEREKESESEKLVNAEDMKSGVDFEEASELWEEEIESEGE